MAGGLGGTGAGLRHGWGLGAHRCSASGQLLSPWCVLNSPSVVPPQDRETKVAAASEAIERDMELLGATAVEDKLQASAGRGREGGPRGRPSTRWTAAHGHVPTKAGYSTHQW